MSRVLGTEYIDQNSSPPPRPARYRAVDTPRTHYMYCTYIERLFGVRDLECASGLDGVRWHFIPSRTSSQCCPPRPCHSLPASILLFPFLSSHLRSRPPTASSSPFGLFFLRFLLIPLPQAFHALLAHLGIPGVESRQIGGRMQTLLPSDELVALNMTFEDAHPREILGWALEPSAA